MENINDVRTAETQKIKFGKTFWLVLWALIGLGLSIKLSVIYFTVNFVPDAAPSFCVINDTIDCDAVAGTIFSQFLGIPLALYGVFLYSFITFMCFVDKLQNIKWLSFLKVFKNKYSYIFTLYLISFTISMILTFVQFNLIKKFCILCFITYLVDFVSLFIAKDYKQSLIYEVKTSVIDFIDAVKQKGYLIAFVVVMICASGVLAFTKFSYIFTPQVKQYDAYNYFQKMKGNHYNIHGNVLGNPDAEVVVYEYSDFECPICPIMNRMLQKASTELDNLYIIHYNYPLDMSCNPLITKPFHQNSCVYARFAIAAKYQNKYWEMINLLFDKKPKTNKDMYKLAVKAGVDPAQLANDFLYKTEKELKEEIMSGIARKINATPTILVNNTIHTGVMPYEDLKQLLIDAGARPKDKSSKEK